MSNDLRGGEIMNEMNSPTPAPRLELELNVNFRRSYARSEDFGRLKNISLTGAFLETPRIETLEVTDKVIVTFVVGGRTREINSKIVWKNDGGCGIEFQPFNNRDIQIVDDLMYFVENQKESKKMVLDTIFSKVTNS